MIKLSLGRVKGLRDADAAKLSRLVDIFEYHQASNETKERYYSGHVPLSEVNLGIALPEELGKLEIGCEWGCKTVDVLASRSMFDGFVSQSGTNPDVLTQIVDDNQLVAEYQKTCRDELKHGAVFATLSADPDKKCKIRFHSELTSAATWDGEKGRVGYGMFILDTVADEEEEGKWIPSVVRMDTDTDVIVMRRNKGGVWGAEYMPHKMGRPLFEAMTWNATSQKPFGRSRIKEPIRRLIQGYVRTVANATIGLEFATAPQKYLLGVTDEQYDAVVDTKFKQYVGNILAATTNPETGANPVFGQLTQGSIEPHVSMLRLLATQFSAATGLTVTDTGVVNDANPTSSDAILAQSQTLVLMAEQLNAANGNALKTIALMAQAIARNVTLEELTDEEKSVVAHFKNPAMPSVSVTADAALKIASVREGFAMTDTFLEMIGFGQADIRRIRAQEQRVRGTQTLEQEFGNAST